MARIRIVIVDDHEIVRYGLRLALELEPDMVVVGEAGTGEEAVRVAATTLPDVILLDVKLGDIDGPDICARVLATAPKSAVLMLTSYLNDALVLRSLIAGAKGYVIKDVELTELKKMIRHVFRGSSVLDPRITTHVISTVAASRRPLRARPLTNHVGALSESDVTIIRGLAEGRTSKEIAARVHLSPHTIRDRIARIGDVLGVRSRAAIVADAVRRGLI
jgi:NarL family two-component system response regulator YdfI